MKILLSCVSTEFKSYSLKLVNQLGALKDHPYKVKVQVDFQQGGYALEHLVDYVQNCDLVIHLVGEASGAGFNEKRFGFYSFVVCSSYQINRRAYK